MFERAAVRGALVTLDAASRAILDCHPYPPALRRVLAELLAASALLASTLKFTGSLIVQLQGDGPVRLLVVECNDALELRATAQWDAERTTALGPDATLAELAGGATQGRLVITLDPKGNGTIYQGIVTLETASVAGLIEHYLATSEQLASRLVLATDARPRRGPAGAAAARRRRRRRTGAGRHVGARGRALGAARSRRAAGAGHRRRRCWPNRFPTTTCAYSGQSR